tara:strand:- start:233 stop:1588 length:1356 start_codon:yes stop_codon:yes gene_type:complete
MSKNSKFISKSFNREGLFNYFLIPYFAVLIYFVYKTSNTLPPFRDEAVSLSANISFYLEGLSFKGPAGTKFEGSYSPYLTSPPLSAVGSSIAWIFSDNFNTIRISNFIWVLAVQVFYTKYISKLYRLDLRKLIIYSGFTLISFPFWFGSLYSLGETISIIIFFNSLLLYKAFPKTSIFMMGWIVFFGKFLLGFLFIFFYIANLLINRNFKKAPLEILLYLIPSGLWFFLIRSKSNYSSISNYLNDFNTIYQNNTYVGEFSLTNLYNFQYIIDNFEVVLSWNPSVILRVFLPPILLFCVLIFKKGEGFMLDSTQLFYFVSSIAPLFGWFILISPDKPLIYATHFTFPLLMYCFYLLSRNDLKINIVNNSAFLICSLYMTSNALFILSIITLILINFSKRLSYSIFIIFISLSLFNSTYEVIQQKSYVVDLETCKRDVTSYDCFEYLMSIGKS